VARGEGSALLGTVAMPAFAADGGKGASAFFNGAGGVSTLARVCGEPGAACTFFAEQPLATNDAVSSANDTLFAYRWRSLDDGRCCKRDRTAVQSM
jgi:hypothetical protein